MAHSPDEIWKEITTGDQEPRRQFLAAYGADVRELCKGIAGCLDALDNAQFDKDNSLRHGAVHSFLVNALNSLLVSSQCLVSGFLVPSGALIRIFGESVAVALLCATPGRNDHARIKETPLKYPYHKAMDQLRSAKVCKALGVDADDVTKLKASTDWYNKYSHPSYFAEAAFVDLSDEKRRIAYGAFFDLAKDLPYRKELRTRTSACRFFVSCCEIAAHALADCDRSVQS